MHPQGSVSFAHIFFSCAVCLSFVVSANCCCDVYVSWVHAGGCYNFSMVNSNVAIVPMLAFFNTSVNPTVTNQSWCYMNLQFQMASYMYVVRDVWCVDAGSAFCRC